MTKFALPILVSLTLSALQVSASENEERAALKKLLPTFKAVWNSGKVSDFITLCHPDSKIRKAYESDAKVKAQIDKEFGEAINEFGKVEKTEIRKYIARKTRFVVRVTYTKKGMLPGTFAMKKDAKGNWFINDFNIDGQGEKELKE